MSNWNRWRVVITATQATEFVLRTEEQGPPVVGPAGEPIDTAKSRVVDYRDDGEVRIKEMETLTGTYFKIGHIKIVAPAGQTVFHVETFDSDINILSAKCLSASINVGDTFCWYVAPNTTVGALGTATAINDTVLDVPQSVMDNVQPLFRIRLADAADPENVYEDVGLVTDMDEVNNTITVTTPVTQVWPATTTLVQMTIVYVQDIEIGNIDFVLEMGGDKIGASFLPKGTPLYCEYKNNGVSTHYMYCYFSYMYGRPGS